MTMFIISGLLGGAASALLWAKNWRDLRRFEFARAVILGAIGGYLYFLMHTEWNVPNGVVAFTFGYAFQDVIEGAVERVKQLLGLRHSSDGHSAK
jgi:4-amino-4-deoxy-L-arabinose transferase-like glycosyltransferase